jgi:hypothetical protein
MNTLIQQGIQLDTPSATETSADSDSVTEVYQKEFESGWKDIFYTSVEEYESFMDAVAKFSDFTV